MMPEELIFKIVGAAEWELAIADGVFRGAEIDLSDGYIHFSSAAQVAETAAQHFAGRDDLILVAIDATRLGDSLKWEPSRGGDLFPHFYGELDLEFVNDARPLLIGDDGVHQFDGMV
jgi:uncharacterized protein (DUF952 family)